MKLHIEFWAAIAVLSAAGGVWAQAPSFNGQYPRARQEQPARPDQPVMPQDPSLQRRVPQDFGGPPPNGANFGPQPGMPQPGVPGPGPQNALPRRFQLTPQEQAQLNQVLQAWENSSSQVKSFSCYFDRLEYRPAFGNQPQVDKGGEIRYATPDKGSFKLEGARPERWICDGKAVYGYDFQTKQIFERKLPPEMQGKAIADGPLPFLFGANAANLKRRYDLRISTPSDANKGDIWLEAYPLFAQDARNFSRAEIILSQAVQGNQGQLLPIAIRIYQPNGTDHTVFVFNKITLNENRFFTRFQNDFSPTKPGLGWQFVADEGPQGNPAMQPPASMGTRPINPR